MFLEAEFVENGGALNGEDFVRAMVRPWDGVEADGWAGAAPVPRCPGGATAGGTRGEEVRLDVSGRTVDQNGGSNAHGTSFPSGRDPFLSLLQVLRTSFDWIRENA